MSKIVFEHFQFTREDRTDNSNWPEWLNEAWNRERGELGSAYPTEEGSGEGTISIETEWGSEVVDFNDFIIYSNGKFLIAYPNITFNCLMDYLKAMHENGPY